MKNEIKMRIRMITVTILFLALFVTLLAVYNHYTRERLYLTAFQETDPHASLYTDYSILCEDTYEDMSVIVVGCTNLSGTRLTGYCFVKQQDDRIVLEIVGGLNPAKHSQENVPLSFSISSKSPWKSPDSPKEDVLMVTFGEIYEHNIKTVALTYNDGNTESKRFTSGGYVFVRNVSSDTLVTSLEAFDEDKNILYRFP